MQPPDPTGKQGPHLRLNWPPTAHWMGALWSRRTSRRAGWTPKRLVAANLRTRSAGTSGGAHLLADPPPAMGTMGGNMNGAGDPGGAGVMFGAAMTTLRGTCARSMTERG